MALARIITRSHSCSRELALNLIARGYAVEIVSPDSIPDNFADLELRVEEDPGKQLVAREQAHNGDRSASLEFVHHLKAPMVDFIRRPPEPHEAVHSPEKHVSFNADQNAEVVEPPADTPQLAPETVSPAAEIQHDAELGPELNRDDGACPVLPPHQSTSPPVEPPGHVAVVVSMMARPIISKPTISKSTIAPSVREWEWRDRPAGWPSWGTALTVVSAVLLALVLSYGVRRTNKASAQSSGPTLKASPSTGVSSSSASNARHTFDEPASRAETSQRSADRHPRSRTQSSAVIAANTVTLNDKPAPKGAKQESDIKHYSDLK
jgi:hypothetical protein